MNDLADKTVVIIPSLTLDSEMLRTTVVLTYAAAYAPGAGYITSVLEIIFVRDEVDNLKLANIKNS